MIFPIPLVIIIGILTGIFLIITFGLGLAVHKYHRPYLRHHIRIAFITIILAIIHGILAFLFF